LVGLTFLWGFAATASVSKAQSSLPAAEFVREIYSLVSSKEGSLPDWDKVRACFLDEAVVVLRTSRSATKVFSREGFIQDFVEFYDRPLVRQGKSILPKESGFTETVLDLKTWEYGDMAHVLVRYEAQIPNVEGVRQQGIDSWALVRRDGQWKVAAVTNEVITPDRPVPAELGLAASAVDRGTAASAVGPSAGDGARPALPTASPFELESVEEKAEAAEQEHYEALYQVAQLHAALGHRDQAYRYLERAVGAGFNDRGRLLDDEAFQSFRDEELFRSLARRAWANGYSGLLERSNREEVQKSPEIMAALAFKPGERVADIGAGTGYFTIPVANAVGPDGRVLALDIAPEMLEYLDFRVKALKIGNIRLRKVERDNPGIEPASVDTILLIDTIHYVKDRVAYAKNLLPALAPGGRVVIIDYFPKSMAERPWGPPPEQQVSRERMDADLKAAGFEVTKAYDFLPEQYFVVYSPVTAARH